MKEKNVTYVVIRTQGFYEDKFTEVLYAGNNEQTAKNTNSESFASLELQMWLNGTLIKSFIKFSSEENLEKNFDLLDDLQSQQNTLESQLEEVKTTINSIKPFLTTESN